MKQRNGLGGWQPQPRGAGSLEGNSCRQSATAPYKDALIDAPGIPDKQVCPVNMNEVHNRFIKFIGGSGCTDFRISNGTR